MKRYISGAISFWVILILITQLAACGKSRGNRKPTAENLAVTTQEDISTDILLRGNDEDGKITGYTVLSTPSHGTLSGSAPYLTYTPNADFYGSDNFSYRVTDNAYSDSSPAVVSITVTAVNDIPVAGEDTYSASGNTQKVVTAPGLLSNDSDPDSPANALTVTAGNFSTSAGGSVDINADGSFTYNPPAEVSSDSFTYTLNDNDSSDPQTATGQVNIALGPTVWYVDDSAAGGGDGTYNLPFNTLAAAATIASSGDTIFVYAGNYTGGITLADSVLMIGEAEGLTVDGMTIPVGPAPVISADSSTDVITLSNNNTLKGVAINSGRNGLVAGDVSNLQIQNLSISDTAASNVNLSNVTGTVSIADSTINNTSAGVDGIAINNAGLTSGTLTLTIDNVQFIGNATGTGLLDAIDLYSGANATLIATLSGNQFSNVYADGIEADILGSSGSDTLTIGGTGIGNTFTGVIGRPMNLVAGDSALVQFDIRDNQLDGNGQSTNHGILLTTSDNSSIDASIINNTLTDIGNTAPAMNSIFVQTGNTQTANARLVLAVQNNTINGNTATGLYITTLGNSDALLTVTGNSIGNNGTSEGVRIAASTSGTEVCLTMDSNSFSNGDVTYLNEAADGSMVRIPAAASISAFSANNGGVTVNTSGVVGFGEACTISP